MKLTPADDTKVILTLVSALEKRPETWEICFTITTDRDEEHQLQLEPRHGRNPFSRRVVNVTVESVWDIRMMGRTRGLCVYSFSKEPMRFELAKDDSNLDEVIAKMVDELIVRLAPPTS